MRLRIEDGNAPRLLYHAHWRYSVEPPASLLDLADELSEVIAAHGHFAPVKTT